MVTRTRILPSVAEPRRRSIILLHHDGQLLDLLTRLFEARGYSVNLAATVNQARAHLDGEREFDAIIAEWDVLHPVGGEVYRWVLEHRFALRDRFVFLADEVPPELDRLVAGRCLTVRASETAEIIRVADATVRRAERARDRGADAQWTPDGRPTLLLADDDPMLLAAMAELLIDAGFAVTAVDSGNAAIAVLDGSEHDVVLAEWTMVNGSGAQLFQWIVTFRPWVVDRVAFLIDRADARIERTAPGRPVFHKGADSRALIAALRAIAGLSGPRSSVSGSGR